MESIRRLVRKCVGYDTLLYRTGAKLLDYLATVKKDGISTWRTLKKLQEARQESNLLHSVSLRNLKYPIQLRQGTQDAHAVINNVIREEYGRFRLTKEPEWMIDAGAYIGDTAAYFLSRFPSLKVIALEPNPPTYEVAKQNLKPYGERAILQNVGLFSAEKVVNFAGDGTGASISKFGNKIQCTTILSILERYSISRLDILKMDIEGAEESVFLSEPYALLSRIDLLLIEIHSKSIESLISRVLYESHFSMKKHRSIWYCRPNK